MAFLSLPGCQVDRDDGSLARVRSTGRLVVGIDPSYPPFAMLDDQGRPDGLEIDLANSIAARIGVTADFVGIDVGGIVDALLAGKIDVVISGLAADIGYGKRVAFSRPYFDDGQVIVARTAGATDLGALSGRSVGVESGSTGDIELRKLLQRVADIRIRSFTGADLALEAVRRGEIDAAITNSANALEYTHRNPGMISGDPFTGQGLVVVARSADSSLLDAINRSLDDLDREGYLRELTNKWLR